MRFPRRFAFGIVALVLGAAAATAGADIARLQVGPCMLEADGSLAAALGPLGEHDRRILARLEIDLGVRPAAPFRMILVAPGRIDDPGLARLDAAAPSWAAGYIVPEIRTGVIRVAQASRYPYGTVESVLAHETTHLLLHDAVPRGLPRWLDEGIATWEERGWRLEDIVVYSTSLLTADLPHLSDLDAEFRASEGEAQLAYAASFAFVSWCARRQGASFVRDLVREARDHELSEAWRIVTGRSLEDMEAAWRKESLFRYRWLPILTASSTMWIGITFLAMIAGFRKRARSRQMRERWAEAEAEEDLAAESDAGSEAFHEGTTHDHPSETAVDTVVREDAEPDDRHAPGGSGSPAPQ